MPAILPLDLRKPRTRLLVAGMYLLLVLGSLTMALPFMITVTGSLSNPVDFPRSTPVLISLFNRSDRFVRGLPNYFQDRPDDLVFRNRPAHWNTWSSVGMDLEGIEAFAQPYREGLADPVRRGFWERRASDYAEFALEYDILDTFCTYDFRHLAGFLREKYLRRVLESDPSIARQTRKEQSAEALAALNEDWGVPYDSFYDVNMNVEIRYPMHHVSWNYPDRPKALSFLEFKDAYRRLEFRPGTARLWRRWAQRRGWPGAPWPVRRDEGEWWTRFKAYVATQCPLTPTLPFSMRTQWVRFLRSEPVLRRLGLPAGSEFGIEEYNRRWETAYRHLAEIPFPLPESAPAGLQELWSEFVRNHYPRRLLEVRPTPELNAAYRELAEQTFRDIDAVNWLMNSDHRTFEDLLLPPRAPPGAAAEFWIQFVGALDPYDFHLHSAEQAWQEFLLQRYSTLDAINAAHGTLLQHVEEAQLPIAEAYAITFHHNEWRHFLHDILGNYRMVIDFLFVRGQAFMNTVFLVILSLLATLTVNPMAAYALSRFRLQWKEQLLLFFMATMAFPAAVSAIPGFLLMRDLGLLNSFAALVLPGLASGMSIFILKGFFDGIPRELYEAATIDGAGEWQMFYQITLPMTTPILAVNSLHAFIAAYGSWEWALLVCQDRKFWTLSVWLYQFRATMGHFPWIIMAGFVIASIPTAIVFIACQKIILRGIVIPSMK